MIRMPGVRKFLAAVLAFAVRGIPEQGASRRNSKNVAKVGSSSINFRLSREVNELLIFHPS
jgi:hypothetical protein